MFLPTRCPLCQAIGPAPCARCAAQLVPAGDIPPAGRCASAAACFRYDAAARALLLALKYRNRRDTVSFCASGLAALAPAVDAVTWAPSTPARVRERGFDQAEVLARATARCLGVQLRGTLVRRRGIPQTGQGAQARRSGPAFGLRRAAVGGVRLLLVDDVITTGSTMAHAADALLAAGAAAVHARAVAWTPPPKQVQGHQRASSTRGKLLVT